MATQKIDIEDLIPAQIAGVMFLIQFGIVQLTAYSGQIDLHQTFDLAGVADVSLAFFINIAAFGIIIFTNEIGADDLIFWEDGGNLDQIYGAAITGTLALIVAVEFWPYMNDLIVQNDVLGTVAFLTSVVATWAIVWIR